MGTVVERAVNGAVETVLAEMLKVVGVKFEELKAQVVLMKRDIAALQREKALKEKENDNIRAKLRYTELKLKYYRQGVEEELQQRASASTLVRIHPSTFPQTHRGGASTSSTDTSPPCSAQTRTTEGTLTRHSQESTSSQNTSRCAIGLHCHSDVGVASADSCGLLLPPSMSVNTGVESVDSSSVLVCCTEQDIAESKAGDQEADCEWTITLPPHAEGLDTALAPPPVQELTSDPGRLSASGLPSPDGSTQAGSSTLPSSAVQVKEEVEQQEQEEEEVICIKEEAEEEQEVMLLDCQVQHTHLPESERSVPDWSGHPVSQVNRMTTFSSAGPSTCPVPQLVASMPSMEALPLSVPPHQAARPWAKDLSLYEEYKLRRNELRRRSLSRRRELEKTLPQPLLADLVRERREKTRLRVARWRAKRKLQACLNQAQAQGGTAGFSDTGVPISSPQQELRVNRASSSRQSSTLAQSSGFLQNMKSAANKGSASLPYITPTSSSSLLLRGPNMAAHQRTVTSSSSSYPQVSLSLHSSCLAETGTLQ